MSVTFILSAGIVSRRYADRCADRDRGVCGFAAAAAGAAGADSKT